MPATTLTGMIQQVLGLIGRAFTDIGNLFGILFIGFLRISPLPDQVDFFLVCLFVIWLISFLVRLINGKNT